MGDLSVQMNIAIVSDLHLSEGRNPRTQRVSRLETFFADRPFERFLDCLQRRAQAAKRPWLLVFNGDLLDFLRVTTIPDPQRLPRGLPYLSATKKSYGLGTSPAESKWQLERILEGHPLFFRALARFLLSGHQVLIIKGNHDVNWFWPEVRYRFLELMQNHLEAALAEEDEKEGEENEPEQQPRREGTGGADGRAAGGRAAAGGGRNREAAEQSEDGKCRISEALDRLQIRAWSYLIDHLLYIEHGNQYDSANAFRNFLYPLLIHPASPVDRYELDLPFGSFFVRYFFNKIQLQHPTAPTYRQTSSYFHSLGRRHFYEAWNIVKNYFPYFFRTLGKIQEKQGPQQREIRGHNQRFIQEAGSEFGRQKEFEEIAALQEPPFEKKFDFFTSVVQSPFKRIGIAFGGIFLFSFAWSLLSKWVLSSETGLLFRTTSSLIVNYAFIILGLLLVLYTLKPSHRGASYREAEPETLRSKAARIAQILQVKYVVFGHSHVTDLSRLPGQESWYLNTGTWIPIVDEDTQTYRPESPYPVVILEDGTARLMRWNDSAGELEEFPLLEDRPGE